MSQCVSRVGSVLGLLVTSSTPNPLGTFGYWFKDPPVLAEAGEPTVPVMR